MRDNVKSGALTEVTFYILLSLYSPKHGYAVMKKKQVGGFHWEQALYMVH